MDDIKTDTREIQTSIAWNCRNRGLYSPNDGLNKKNQKLSEKNRKMTAHFLFRIIDTGNWKSFGGFRGLLGVENDDFTGNR